MGWLMKISRAFVHKYRISVSSSWTGFPGLFPRTVDKLVFRKRAHHGTAEDNGGATQVVMRQLCVQQATQQGGCERNVETRKGFLH